MFPSTGDYQNAISEVITTAMPAGVLGGLARDTATGRNSWDLLSEAEEGSVSAVK